jgi:hypothetical protein
MLLLRLGIFSERDQLRFCLIRLDALGCRIAVLQCPSRCANRLRSASPKPTALHRSRLIAVLGMSSSVFRGGKLGLICRDVIARLACTRWIANNVSCVAAFLIASLIWRI